MRRISFVPRPAGFRFYHTHVVPRADLSRGQYSGLVGPVYIEPAQNPGTYDQEIFLTLKEFEPVFSRGGDMTGDFLAGEEDPDLKGQGESAMNASVARGDPHGYEVSYATPSKSPASPAHPPPAYTKTSRCWGATRAWRSTSSPTNPGRHFCTATSRYTWTTAS